MHKLGENFDACSDALNPWKASAIPMALISFCIGVVIREAI